MPWTTLWGGKVLGSISAPQGKNLPSGSSFPAATSIMPPLTPDGEPPSASLTIDELVQRARAAGARGDIELHPALHGGPFNVRDDHPRAWDEVWLQLDGRTGAVLTRVDWSDFPAIRRFVSLGIDLHEGHFFGRANQVFNTVFALALVWLSATGFIGWYQRRPHGGMSPPPKRDVRLPGAVVATAIALCIALPLLGASVLAIALVDRFFGRALPGHMIAALDNTNDFSFHADKTKEAS